MCQRNLNSPDCEPTLIGLVVKPHDGLFNSNMMEKEIFKNVPGYEGLYEVSNFGNVKSSPKMRGKIKLKERILSKLSDGRGYLKVILYKNGNSKNYKIHQLVAMAFLGHKPSGHKIVVDHIDYNRKNNDVKNLQLISNRENKTKDRWRKNYSSKFAGVTYSKSRKRWCSQMVLNYRHIHLGYFDSESEASEAYRSEIKKLNK